jgi:hypothetical protein
MLKNMLGDVEWMHLAWQALVNTVMNIRASYIAEVIL